MRVLRGNPEALAALRRKMQLPRRRQIGGVPIVVEWYHYAYLFLGSYPFMGNLGLYTTNFPIPLSRKARRNGESAVQAHGLR